MTTASLACSWPGTAVNVTALAGIDATARYGILLLPAATTGPHCGRADGVHWRARQWACPPS